jgi:plasmid stabilization system protein ParE
VPNAIVEDFESTTRMLARTPWIGRRATKTTTPNVRQVFLPRVGYFIYYRVIGSPPVLEVMAFWHSRRGKGPPI